MTPLVSQRRRVEEFARAVDGAVPPVHRSLLEPFQLVATIRAAQPPEADPSFVSGLRGVLLTAAATELPAKAQPATARSRPASRQAVRPRRRLALAGAALVALGGSGGVAAASQQALPGEMLYPVKRAIEDTEVLLAWSDSSRGEALLEHAETRLTEVESLVEGGGTSRPDQIDAALSDFSIQASDGGGMLLGVYQEDREASTLTDLRLFTANAADSLGESASSLPASVSDELVVAFQTIAALDATAVSVCPECTSTLPPLEVPAPLLALLPASAPGFPVITLPPLPGQGGSGSPAATPTPPGHGSSSPPSTSPGGSGNQYPGGTQPPTPGATPTVPGPSAPQPPPQPSVPVPSPPTPSLPTPTAPIPTVPTPPVPTLPTPTLPSLTLPTPTLPSLPLPSVPTLPTLTAPSLPTLPLSSLPTP